MSRWRPLTRKTGLCLRTNVVFGQSLNKTRFQNDLGFVLSQGLTPFTNVDYKAYMTEHQAFTEGDEWKE